jgi:hypothetical protein
MDRAASFRRRREAMADKTYGKPSLGETMHHVYLLRSLSEPKQTYIGLTDDMRTRLRSHN